MSALVIVREPSDGVRVLTLNRPERRNALNQALSLDLCRELDIAAATQSVRAVILTGDERAFCAGADIHEMQQADRSGVGSRAEQSLWRKMESFQKPLIAAVAGVAFGGGLELALLCDSIIVGDNARIAQPEVKIGAMPGGGGTQRLPRLVGLSLATHMLLTGQEINAATAVQAGLALRSVPAHAVLEEAVRLAALIAANAPLAVRATKAAILASVTSALADGLALERALHDEVFASADRKEGMLAFLEKRPARFREC